MARLFADGDDEAGNLLIPPLMLLAVQAVPTVVERVPPGKQTDHNIAGSEKAGRCGKIIPGLRIQ